MIRCKLCRQSVAREDAIIIREEGCYCRPCYGIYELDEEIETIEESPQLVARVERLRRRIREHHLENGIIRGQVPACESSIGAIREVTVYSVRRNGLTYLGDI